MKTENFSKIYDLYRVATLEEQKFYEDMLYPLQDIVFDIVQTYGPDLYLTGGTALARFHFSHRLSEDLDFFTTTDDLQVIANDLRLKLLQQGFEVETDRLSVYFARLYLLDKDVRLKIEFAKEFHLIDPLVQTDKHIYLNSLEDIGANKISAFEDRATVKDLIDLYYITQQISLPRLFELADMKRVPVAYEQLLTIHTMGLTGNAFLTRPLVEEELSSFLQKLVEETCVRSKKKEVIYAKFIEGTITKLLWDFPHERRNLNKYSIPILRQRQSNLPLPEQYALYSATESYLDERAQRGSKTNFLAAMANVDDVETPDVRDKIPALPKRTKFLY